MAYFGCKKERFSFRSLLPFLFFLLVLILFIFLCQNITTANSKEQTKILERAVTQSITQCYALEGAYPPNITYLEEHYGLTYDTDSYFIDYQYIGSNLRPDVTIIKKE